MKPRQQDRGLHLRARHFERYLSPTQISPFPKRYRFCVRFTNRDVICQVIRATIAGDIVVSAAYAHELKDFGLTVGLTNYAAAYATGLLCARRTLKKYGLDEQYEGQTDTEKIGEDFNVEADDEKRPFKALLDVGLIRTSSGAKVFGALKVGSVGRVGVGWGGVGWGGEWAGRCRPRGAYDEPNGFPFMIPDCNVLVLTPAALVPPRPFSLLREGWLPRTLRPFLARE